MRQFGPKYKCKTIYCTKHCWCQKSCMCVCVCVCVCVVQWWCSSQEMLITVHQWHSLCVHVCVCVQWWCSSQVMLITVHQWHSLLTTHRCHHRSVIEILLFCSYHFFSTLLHSLSFFHCYLHYLTTMEAMTVRYITFIYSCWCISTVVFKADVS